MVAAGRDGDHLGEAWISAELLHILYLVAIVAEAMTAALAAGRRQMDWVGVYLLGCVTALGGGSVRDVLLDRHPPVLGGASALSGADRRGSAGNDRIARYMHQLRRLFLFLDAVGLVVFTVIGCNVAMELGMPLIIVVASGMVTGCAGGVLRDILCADVPLLFRAELYATVSVVTGGIYVAGRWSDLPHDLLMVVAMAVGLKPEAARAALRLEHAEIRLYERVAPGTLGAELTLTSEPCFPLSGLS